MVNPPKEGDASYTVFKKESNDIIESLKKRARMVVSGFNAVKDVTCNAVEGVCVCMCVYVIVCVCVCACTYRRIACLL